MKFLEFQQMHMTEKLYYVYVSDKLEPSPKLSVCQNQDVTLQNRLSSVGPLELTAICHITSKKFSNIQNICRESKSGRRCFEDWLACIPVQPVFQSSLCSLKHVLEIGSMIEFYFLIF